jgi:hypothetical protein
MKLPGIIDGCDARPALARLPAHWLRCCGPSVSSEANPAQTTTGTTGANAPITTGESSPLNQNNGGLSLTATSGGTVSSDPIVSADALNAVQNVVTQVLQSQGNTAQTLANSINSTLGNSAQQQLNENQLLQSVLSAQGTLAAQTQSGGQTTTDKTLIWVVLAALAALVLITRK